MSAGHDEKLLFPDLAQVFRFRVGARIPRIEQHGDSGIILAGQNQKEPDFFRDESGWAVLDGIVIDTRATDTPVRASQILNETIETRPIDLESLDVAFSVAIRDAHRGVELAACGQLGIQRTYYHVPSDERGASVSTHALPLVRALGLSWDAGWCQRVLDPRDPFGSTEFDLGCS